MPGISLKFQRYKSEKCDEFIYWRVGLFAGLGRDRTGETDLNEIIPERMNHFFLDVVHSLNLLNTLCCSCTGIFDKCGEKV